MEDNNKIQELIEEFDFSSLTENQQKMVLSEMTEKEYQELREAIKMTVDYFDNEPKLFIDDSLKPLINKENMLIRAINYKIPLYKVAAAVALIVSINLLLINEKENETLEIAEYTEETFTLEEGGLDELQKYTSNNAIKYNTGLARLY